MFNYKITFFIILLMTILASCAQTKIKRNDKSTLVSAKLGVCRGKIIKKRFDFEGEILLSKKFLKNKTYNDDEINKAIKLQLNYLSGNLYNKEDKTYQAIISFDRNIQVLAVIETTYGQEMLIGKLESPKFEVYSDYVKRAVSSGKTKTNDPAINVSYKTSFEIVSCLDKRQKIQNFTFYYPNDPYLAYWMIPSKKRIHKKWISISEGVVNPCSTDELTDFPVPEYFWYFWKIDYKDTKINCLNYYNKKNVLTSFRINLVPEVDQLKFAINQDVDNYLKKKDTIKIGIIYGAIKNKNEVINYTTVARNIDSIMNDTVKREVSSYMKSDKKNFYSNFFKNLTNIFTITKNEIKVKDGHILQHIDALSKRSKRKFSLNIYYGPTDIFEDEETHHWSFYLDALREDDIILYAGHSGLGENLSYQNALKYSKKSISFEKKLPVHPRIIGFFSCYSFSYFGKGLKKAFPNGKLRLIYTGSSPGVGHTMMEGYLDIMDQSFSQLNEKLASPFLRDDDFLIIKERI